MSLGPILKRVRAARGLGQADFANNLQFDRSTVSAWEQDRRVPNAAQLRGICVHLGVSADVLLELAPFSLPPIEEVTP